MLLTDMALEQSLNRDAKRKVREHTNKTHFSQQIKHNIG